MCPGYPRVASLPASLGDDGALIRAGEEALVAAVAKAASAVSRLNVDEVLAFVTSVVRDGLINIGDGRRWGLRWQT